MQSSREYTHEITCHAQVFENFVVSQGSVLTTFCLQALVATDKRILLFAQDLNAYCAVHGERNSPRFLTLLQDAHVFVRNLRRTLSIRESASLITKTLPGLHSRLSSILVRIPRTTNTEAHQGANVQIRNVTTNARIFLPFSILSGS